MLINAYFKLFWGHDEESGLQSVMVSMDCISLSCLGEKLKIQAYLLCPIETCAACFGGCVVI